VRFGGIGAAVYVMVEKKVKQVAALMTNKNNINKSPKC